MFAATLVQRAHNDLGHWRRPGALDAGIHRTLDTGRVTCRLDWLGVGRQAVAPPAAALVLQLDQPYGLKASRHRVLLRHQMVVAQLATPGFVYKRQPGLPAVRS